MMRYKSAGGNPFGWLSEPAQALVHHFIRSMALDFYRGWVRGGEAVPVDEAAGLLADRPATAPKGSCGKALRAAAESAQCLL